MVRLYEKLHKATAALEWFTTRDWDFKSTNVIQLSQELEGIDQKASYFILKQIHPGVMQCRTKNSVPLYFLVIMFIWSLLTKKI